ncbi:hypothetical protein D9M68_834180 [compost metagenome]
MLQAAELQITAQFDLADAVVPGGFALAEAPRQGTLIASEREGLGGIAAQRAFLEVTGQAQLPGIVEGMLEAGLDQVVGVVDSAVARLAEEGRARHAAQPIIRRDHAAVEH